MINVWLSEFYAKKWKILRTIFVISQFFKLIFFTLKLNALMYTYLVLLRV